MARGRRNAIVFTDPSMLLTYDADTEDTSLPASALTTALAERRVSVDGIAQLVQQMTVVPAGASTGTSAGASVVGPSDLDQGPGRAGRGARRGAKHAVRAGLRALHRGPRALGQRARGVPRRLSLCVQVATDRCLYML